MKIQEKYYHTIWLSQNDSENVQIIDQRYLPFEFRIENLKTPEDVFAAIQDMHVRGAPLIGVTAAFGIYLAALQKSTKEHLAVSAGMLKTARPTAVNLQYAVDRIMNELSAVPDGKALPEKALNLAQELKQEEIDNCYRIGMNGLPLIEEISRKKKGETVNILTHCNAGWLACIDYGTATAPIYFAHDKSIKVHVWVDETRPRNQGARLTAWELGQHGVPHTIIADNTGGHLMQHGLVDMVITGCDRAAVTGDAANKIGTYLKALAAKDNNVPFYVALPFSSFDMTIHDGINEIPVEMRGEEEVKYIQGVSDSKLTTVRITPENSKAVNYGFDVTPARLITALVTEKGVCEAKEERIRALFNQVIAE